MKIKMNIRMFINNYFEPSTSIVKLKIASIVIEIIIHYKIFLNSISFSIDTTPSGTLVL